jgi:hypothetical protein
MSADLTPKSSERAIQDHLKHYYSLLRSGEDFPISSLFNYFRLLQPSLQKKLELPELDISALNYALPRLPECILETKQVVIAQSKSQLTTAGIDVSNWELQGSPARRRQNYFDRVTKTLVILINSDSDTDDFINCLVSLQMERQKTSSLDQYQIGLLQTREDYSVLQLDESGWLKLKKIIGSPTSERIVSFCRQGDITVRALPQNEQFIKDVVADWWHKISVSSLIFGFNETPLYFVSSNLHSLTNIVGGFVNDRQDHIITHISKNYPDMYRQWQMLKTGSNELRVIDFLYYASSKYLKDNSDEAAAKIRYEETLGIRRLNISTQLPCDVQIVPLSAIAKSRFRDPNLNLPNPDRILNSQAYILNIEYPLGFSAYYILSTLLNDLKKLKGVYVIGKAAILSGQVGDVQIAKDVFDERTNNVFHIDNAFNTYFPFPAFQSAILQNQKAIAVYGTYLENENQLQNYIKSGFNIIEMESGPYLTAIHQYINKQSEFSTDVVANISQPGFDLGIINYASDNPLSQTLGDAVMSIKGVEPTYLAALTTIQRIIDVESA